MPLQNNDILLVNRNGNSHRYSFENLKRDVLSDIELQLTGLEWVTALPTRPNEISGLPNVAATPRDWDSVTSIILGAGNDISEVTLGATVILTNTTSGNSGTYDIISIDVGANTIGVTYMSDTGGDIQQGNTFQIAVLSLGASGVTISEDAPQGAQQGQLWWNTDDGRLYVFYEDGDTSQWVDASPDTLVDQHWQRTGTTLSPQVAGDNVDLGTGDISGAAATFTGDLSAAVGTLNGGLDVTGGVNVLGLPGTSANVDIRHPTDAGTGRNYGRIDIDGKNVGDVPAFTVFNSLDLDATTTNKFIIQTDGGVRVGGTNTNPAISLTPAGLALEFKGAGDVAGASFASYGNDRAYVDARDGIICRGGSLAGNAAGVSLSSGATSWVSTSDERLKTELVPITDGLNKVSSLRAVTGRYLSDDTDVSRSLLIAQDVQKVLPQAVDDNDPDQLGLRYTEVIPLLVSALHDVKDRIEALEAEVQQLKGGN